MPSARERKCCQEEPLNRTHLADYEKGKCLLECAAIQHILHELSVQALWLAHRRFFGHTADELNFNNMTNKNYRHHAYHGYINFMFGKLGRHCRKVIPACIVQKIREKWPEPSGQYVGFVDVNDDGETIEIDEAEDI